MVLTFDRRLRDAWTFEGDHAVFEFPTGFMQGRSVYGGLTTAAATALGYRMVADRPLRTVQTLFLRPASPGPVVGRAQILREGKYTSFVRVSLEQDGEDVLLVDLVFAVERDATEVHHPVLAEESGPDGLVDIPDLEGMTPQFLKNFQVRWTVGGFPYSGAPEALLGGWIRSRSPLGDAEGVIAMLDAWPCPSLCKVQGFATASSVSWTAHVVREPSVSDDWYRFRYRTVVGRGGMHSTKGELYDRSGHLVAWTEQLVAVFG